MKKDFKNLIQTAPNGEDVVTMTFGEFLGEDSERSSVMQGKVLKAMLEDEAIFEKLIPYIGTNVWCGDGTDILSKLMRIMHDAWTSFGIKSTFETVRNEIRRKTAWTKDVQDDLLDGLDEIQSLSSEDRDAIVSQALTYFIATELLANDNKAKKYLNTNEPERAIAVIRKFYDRVDESESPIPPLHNPIDGFDAAVETIEERVPTAIKGLDENIEGGMFRGGIVLFEAFAGQGKTSISTVLSVGIAGRGYNVLLCNFEDTQKSIDRKVYAAITNEKIKDFKKGAKTKEEFADLKKIIENHPSNGHLKTQEAKTGMVTVKDINRMIKDFINKGFVPDVVILDYLSCIKLPNARTQWEAEETVMRELERIARNYNIVLYVMEQLRNIQKMEDARQNEGALAKGSVAKEQVASVVMRLTRDKEQIRTNRATLQLTKVRDTDVKEREFKDFHFDASRCEIDLTNQIFSDEDLIYDE